MQRFNSRCADVQFNLVRGDTLYFNFQVQDSAGNGVDLSAYDFAKMQLRENEYSEPVLTLTSTGGTIDISNISAGQIIINTQTNTVDSTNYYYDFELSNDEIIETVMTGKVIFKNDYTSR